MRYRIFLLMFSGITIALSGQSPDSLAIALTHRINSPAEMEQFYQLRKAFRSAAMDLRLQYYHKGIRSADALDQLDYRILFRRGLSEYYETLDSLNLAMEKIDEGIALATENRHTSLVTLYNDKAILFSKLSDYDPALKYYILSVEYADSFAVAPEKRFALGNISRIHRYRQEYSKAKYYTLEALKINQSLPEEEAQGSTLFDYSQLGDIYKELGKADSSLYYYQKAIALAKAIPDPKAQANNYLKVSQLHLNQHNIPGAKLYQDSSQHLGSKLDSTFSWHAIHLNEARILLTQKQYPQVEQVLKKIDPERFNFQGKKKYYTFLIEYCRQINDYHRAFDYQGTLHELIGKVEGAQRDRYMVYTEAKFNASQKGRQIQELQQAALISKASIQRQRAWIMASLISVVSILVVVFFLQRDNQRKLKFNRALQQKVAEQTLELREANEELQHFNYIISHDLKEPLRNIVSFSSLIKRKFSGNPELDEFLQIISRSGEQLHHLVRDVLEYQGVGKFPKELAVVDTGIVIEEVRHSLAKFISERNGRILHQNLPTIHTIKGPLTIIFKNLIENGLKYNHSSFPTVTLKYDSLSDRHLFQISDNGIGIEKQYFQTVFQMFKRLNARDQYPGSGLGLAICQKVTKQLNGELKIKASNLEHGTTFELSIPK